MSDTETLPFPFVEALPKREKKKAASAWEVLREYQRLTDEHGCLVPPRLVAKCLALSNQRVHQLINEARLRVVDVNGHPFVTKNSLVEFANSERKNGRPVKVVRLTIRDNLSAGEEIGEAITKEK